MDNTTENQPVSPEWIPSLDDIENAPPGLSYVSAWDYPLGNHPFIAPSELMNEQEETSK